MVQRKGVEVDLEARACVECVVVDTEQNHVLAVNQTEVNIDDDGIVIKVDICIVDGDLYVEFPNSNFIEAGNIFSGHLLTVHAEDFASQAVLCEIQRRRKCSDLNAALYRGCNGCIHNEKAEHRNS